MLDLRKKRVGRVANRIGAQIERMHEAAVFLVPLKEDAFTTRVIWHNCRRKGRLPRAYKPPLRQKRSR